MAKKTHPADARNAEIIAAADSFKVQLFLGRGKYASTACKTLDEARAAATALQAEHPDCSRQVAIYAIAGESSALVEGPNAASAARKVAKAAKAAPAAKAKAKAAKAPAKAKGKAAKAPAPADGKGSRPGRTNEAKARREAALKALAMPANARQRLESAARQGEAAPATRPGSKSETIMRLLTQKGGTTRREIVEATNWPSINLNTLLARKGMKLVKGAEGNLSAASA